MANSSFKRVCLFCLTSKNCHTLINEKEEDVNPRRISFKMFLRYLKVNRVTSHLLGVGVKDVANLVYLCDDCSQVINDFFELYQDFESIRIQLDLCVEQLYEFVVAGGQDPDRGREFEALVTTGEMEDQNSSAARMVKDLRQQVIDKVALKVGSSLPRIAMGTKLEERCEDIKLKSGNTPPVQVPLQIGNEDEAEKGKRVEMDMDDDSIQIHPDTTTTTTTTEQVEEASPSCFSSTQSELSATLTPTTPSWECAYCHKHYSRKNSLLAHQFCEHATVLLSDEGMLPPGISEEQLDASVEVIIGQQHHHHPSNFQCPLHCQRQEFQFKSDVRAHLFQFHLDDVLENVGKVPLRNSLDKVLENIGSDDDSRNVGLRLASATHSPDITKIIQNSSTSPFEEPASASSEDEENMEIELNDEIKPEAFINNPEENLDSTGHDQSAYTGSESSVEVREDLLSASEECQKSTLESVDSELETEQQWKCVYCDKQCSKKGSLRTHMFQRHAMAFLSDEGLLPPQFSEQDLEASLASILGKLNPTHGQLQCSFCEQKGFQNKIRVKTHLLYNHLQIVIENPRDGEPVPSSSRSVGGKTKSLPTTRWECIPCQHCFASKQGLQFHQLSFHTMTQLSSEGRLPPGISEEQLEKSLKSILDEVDVEYSKFQCPFCDKMGSSRRRALFRMHLLQNHLQEVLDDNTENSEPAPQGMLSASSTAKILPLENDTRLKCVPCAKTFSAKENFEKHNLLKHTSLFVTKKCLLPIGISEKQLDSSLETIVGEAGNRCPFCKTTAVQLRQRMRINIKAHLLLKHLPQFIERVKELSLANGNQVSGKDNSDSSSASSPCLKLGSRKQVSPPFLKRNLRPRKIQVQSTSTPRVPVKKLCRPQLQKDAGIWKCAPCGTTFSQKNNFQTHQMKIHPKSVLKNKLSPTISEKNLIDAADRIVMRK